MILNILQVNTHSKMEATELYLWTYYKLGLSFIMFAAIIVLGGGKRLILQGGLLGVAIWIVAISNFDINVAITIRGGSDVMRFLVVSFLHVDIINVTDSVALSPRPHRLKEWLSRRLKPAAMHLTLFRQCDVVESWRVDFCVLECNGFSHAMWMYVRLIISSPFQDQLIWHTRNNRNSEKTRSIHGDLSKNLVYRMHERANQCKLQLVATFHDTRDSRIQYRQITTSASD